MRGVGGGLRARSTWGWASAIGRGGTRRPRAEFGTSGATACDYFFLAMAQHKQGNPEAAKTLAKGVELQGQSRASPVSELAGFGARPFAGGWQSRVAEDELRKEAEGLILGKK